MRDKPPYVKVIYSTPRANQQEFEDFMGKLIEDLKNEKAVSLGYRNQVWCQWTEQDDRFSTRYETSCGNSHVFTFGNVFGNDFKYCPYCGCDIEEVTNDD